jgi:hypothetical protein
MYVDRELHVLCLELVLHLLSSPSGQLDPLQLPQHPTGNHNWGTNLNMLRLGQHEQKGRMAG